MYARDDQEGLRHTNPCSQPTGEGKGEIHQYGDDEHEEEDSQGGGRQKTHHLVYHVKLDIFRLKPKIVFQHLYQLGNRLNVLVA